MTAKLRDSRLERHTPVPSGVPVDLTWQAHAACRGTDPRLWYPVTQDPVTDEHHRYCTSCPVFERCLVHAIRHEQFGVWALTDEDERKRMRRDAGITLATPGWLSAVRSEPDEPDTDELEEAAGWL